MVSWRSCWPAAGALRPAGGNVIVSEWVGRGEGEGEGFKGVEEVEVVVNGDGATEGRRRKGLNVELARRRARGEGRRQPASQPMANL